MQMRLFIATLVFASGVFAQQPSGSVLPMTDADVAAMLNRISRRAARLDPMLEQLHPSDWIARGAPDTYLSQWNSIREQYPAIQSDMSDLLQHPDRLTAR